MQTQITNEQLILKATNLLKDYVYRINSGSIEDNRMEGAILNLCKDDCEINPYGHHVNLISILKIVAKPKVQKVLLEEMDERELSSFVDLLEKLISFFRDMFEPWAEAALKIKDLEYYSYNYDDLHLQSIINETESKLKSIDPVKIKTNGICKN